MKYVIAIAVVITALIAFTPKHLITPDRDGLIYFLTNIKGTDTTYHLFSLYGMRRGAEYEIVDTIVTRYWRNNIEDSMCISFSQGEALGIGQVKTFENTTLIDFCVYEYHWIDGINEPIAVECPEQ